MSTISLNSAPVVYIKEGLFKGQRGRIIGFEGDKARIEHRDRAGKRILVLPPSAYATACELWESDKLGIINSPYQSPKWIEPPEPEPFTPRYSADERAALTPPVEPIPPIRELAYKLENPDNVIRYSEGDKSRVIGAQFCIRVSPVCTVCVNYSTRGNITIGGKTYGFSEFGHVYGARGKSRLVSFVYKLISIFERNR